MKQFTMAAATDAVTERELRNKEIAYRAALEGIVLLKNENRALPIDPGKIALYGAGATRTIKGGTGSGEVNERHAVTILEGLEAAGFEITTRAWLDDFEKACEEDYAAYRKAHKFGLLDAGNALQAPYTPPVGRLITDEDIAASETDTAVFVVSRQAGEGADKDLAGGDFDLKPDEIANIKKIAASYEKSILIINSGSYMALPVLDEAPLSAVLFFCQQGMEGGRALADLLTGKVSPSAKLTDTWAKTYADIPCGDTFSYLSGDVSREDYREGIYVGYRYFDTFRVEPRFPFGFGLSYTNFAWHVMSSSLRGEWFSALIAVTNQGVFPGKEVLQVYTSSPAGKIPKEYQRLVAFAKTKTLAPGETEKLELSFSLRDMATYDEANAAYVLEKGEYLVRLGNSSAKTSVVACLTATESVTVSQHKRVAAPEAKVADLEPVIRHNESGLVTGTQFAFCRENLKTEVIEYKTPEVTEDPTTLEILNRLSVKEMADVCVGCGIAGMIATDHFFVPGAVGRTTSSLYKKGLINVNLSDGPAGLRLLRVSGTNRRGKLRFVEGNNLLSLMDTLPKGIMKAISVKENAPHYYQYCTAFPVGTALAQSWNTELCEEIGRAVSDEMTEYGITYWLAPAMNIHRNPLCGRNFEYLSEDPVLTGRIAAALTRGVQSVPGNYVTIKHFCCNNQENNRNRNNSCVDERPLREIYLKGFEIAVREGHAKALMTSYNLVNGTYTPNRADLLTDVLRCEWGFDGIVMTDWFSTNKGLGRNDLAIAAGNDMIMPGGGAFRREIVKGVRKGTVSEEALRRAAAGIIYQIVHSKVAETVKPEDFK